MKTFITRFTHQIKQSSHSRKERWLWFFFLYGSALFLMFLVMMIIHALVELLITL